jgi:hypothetical protein
VLQYTLNDGSGWKTIGELQTGINWYGNFNIQGQPGGQGLGWSNAQDTAWVTARHDLDELMGESSVRLRIAYGADGEGIANEGFAFDNVWIGNRQRKVLFEHFTNAADETSKTVNESINQVINANSQDIIDLQYHLSYPGTDPFYDQNPEVADAREIYYDIGSVPYSFMDGGRNNNQGFIYKYGDDDMLEEDDIKKAVLHDRRFDIDASAYEQSGIIYSTVDIMAAENYTENALIVHVAIIEQRIDEETGANGETVFESVVHSMLPTALGTLITQSWTAGEERSYAFNWETSNIYNMDEVRVVAFIQNEETKEVYQAEITDLSGNPTTVEETVRPGKPFVVYPNPSGGTVWIGLSSSMAGARYELYDSQYRLLSNGVCSGQLTRLECNGLQPGMYFISMYSNDERIGTQKLIITRMRR